MVSQSLHRLSVVRDGPATHAYVSLFVLLFASQSLTLLFVRGIDIVSGLVPDVLDPQMVGAMVYATLAMVALAAAYSVYRARRPASDQLQRHDLVQLGGVAAMLLLVAAYLLHGAVDVPVFPGDVLTSLLHGGVAMGLLAFAYAKASEFDLRLDVPGRESAPLAGVAVVLGATAGVGQFAVPTALGNSVLPSGFLGEFAPRFSAGLLAWHVILPGACVGIGMGALYNGAVQDRLRERLGPAGAIAAVTTLVGVLGWAFVAGGLANSAVGVVVSLAAVVLLSLLGAFVASRGLALIARQFDVDATPAVGASVGVAVVAVPLVGLAVLERSTAGIAAGGVALTVVAAVASVAYERSRSVWLPALAFVSYEVAGDSDLLFALMGSLG